MSDAPNLGYLFYVKYFRDFFDETNRPVGWKKLDEMRVHKSEADKKTMSFIFQKKNEMLTGPLLDGYTSSLIAGAQTFRLQTIYPGLLIGSGYTHETNLMNEFKLGFFFDHTTGLPHIPGSSVKGVLRSAFVDWTGLVLEIWTEMRQEALKKAAQEDLEATQTAWPALDAGSLGLLELEIFGARVRAEPGCKGKDIFHDAVPVLPDGKTNQKLLANDFITPHINRDDRALDPFTDPTPIQFLKVGPEVTFCFQFELTNGLISKVQKLALFRQILLNLGAGAKTNAGYGQFNPA